MNKSWKSVCRISAMGGLAAIAMAGAAQSASAATTVLDFSGNICGAAGNQACSNFVQIGTGYGDGVGVDVGYRSILTATETTSENFLKYWSTGYGDLVGNVWGGSDSTGYASEITFTALAGYELTLLGYDAGCYLDRAICRASPFSVTEIGGGLVASGTDNAPANGHDTKAFGLAYSATGYVLRWGPDGYDHGLDNIAFDVRAIAPVGGVPEPSAWALLILGFGIIGAGMRRKGSVRLRYA